MPRYALEVVVVGLLLLWLLRAFAYALSGNLPVLLVPAVLVVIVIQTVLARRVLG